MPALSTDAIELECLPYGVNQAEEGICLLIRMGAYRVLLDCGLRDLSALKTDASQSILGETVPSRRRRQRNPALDWPADVVLCTHAHPDHSRGLLELHRTFPQLPIYASEVTTQLLHLNWPEEELSISSPFCQALPWRSPVEFRDGLSAELFPAGHLPGAAAILLAYTGFQRTYTLFYTGDFFLSNSRLVEGMRLEELRGLKPDVLIVEGSYGTARHPHRRQQENQIAERISKAIALRESVILPVPTLGLGQELLMLLRSHHLFTGRDLDIWVDDTIAAGCDAYLDLLPHLPATVQNFAQHQALFWDERVRPRVRRLTPEHRPTLGQSPCIILIDQNANFNDYCQPETGPWTVLLPLHPGYPHHRQQWVEALANGGESPSVQIETYLLSQHSDGSGTTQLIHNLRPQHVIFMHGSPSYLADLAGLDELHNRYHLHTPSPLTLVELPIGDTFVQPAAPDNNYEGELSEYETTVSITLPESITSDRRWQTFADTGLVEARWQGEELVLRGVPQRDLIAKSDAKVPPDLACCGNCIHYRGQRCRNPASPLFDFKVTPDGYCPVFERLEPTDEG
ncbi:MBL fold metallo-hydrolase [Desertifilum tharense]|uniref:MBL fold metallo-hydrolase n=1 Tax=Desertifilum TaxID=1185872 RepID=UPI000A685C07|nr:MBL fold metallo-hydrolase [Desertifilum tharense]MDA0212274.1 MBL fold metallo-hydrolase [Cyanobacteria bacterium FC1]